MRVPAAALLAGGLVLALASCAGGDPICINGGTDCTKGPVTVRSFNTEVAPSFVGRCDLSGCHDVGAEGNMDLSAGCAAVYAEVVTEDRLDTSDGTGPRVLPGDSASTAFFILKSQNLSSTVHTGGGALQTGTPQYTVLADWINGTRENDCP